MKNIKKIAIEILAKTQKFIVDDDLVKSLHSLIKRNNGKWLSDKQKKFFLSKLSRGKITKNPYTDKDDDGAIYSTQQSTSSVKAQKWFFIIDEEGVRERYLQKFNWKEGKSWSQVKKMYDGMSDRIREMNQGLQREDAESKYVAEAPKLHWKR